LITGKIEQLKKSLENLINSIKERLLGNCWKVLYFDKDVKVVDVEFYPKKHFSKSEVKYKASLKLLTKDDAVMFDVQKFYFKGCK